MQEEITTSQDGKASKLWWSLLALAVMAVGAGMRVWFYHYNRSMYRDEAALALNIVHRSFTGLFKPLDNDQGAPVGFLLLKSWPSRCGGTMNMRCGWCRWSRRS